MSIIGKRKTWGERFKGVLSFKEKHKKLPTGNNYSPDRFRNSLAWWLTTQRQSRKKGKLTEEQIKLLESLGIVWDTQKENKEKWLRIFNKLVEFRKKHPDRWPSYNARDKNERFLCKWCINNRMWQRGKVKGCADFPKERERKLNSIGFEWYPRYWERIWEKRYKELKTYLENHSNKWPPFRTGLHNWMTHQREALRKDKLSQERVDMLNKIGFDWHPADWENRWLQNYEKLKAYREENPKRWPPMTMEKLHNWYRNQKENYRRGKLSQERIDLLNRVGIVWNIREKWGSRN